MPEGSVLPMRVHNGHQICLCSFHEESHAVFVLRYMHFCKLMSRLSGCAADKQDATVHTSCWRPVQ